MRNEHPNLELIDSLFEGVYFVDKNRTIREASLAKEEAENKLVDAINELKSKEIEDFNESSSIDFVNIF